LLIDAYKLLFDRGIPNKLGLLLSGPQDPRAGIVAYARQIGIPEERIILLNAVEADALPDVYRQAALFAFPSLYEGFGLPLIEAMAMGLPVVALNRSTMPEVLGSSGILVDQANPIDFAAGIQSALARAHGQGDEVSALARRRAAQFDWDTAGRAIVSVLKQAVRDNTR